MLNFTIPLTMITLGTFSNTIRLCTVFMIGMATHEMHSSRIQFLLALTTVFRVEVLGCALHLLDFCLHLIYVLHVFVNLLIVLFYIWCLFLQLRFKETFDNFEFHALLGWKDFKYNERRKDVLFTNESKCFFKILFWVRLEWEVSKVDECLNPEITILCWLNRLLLLIFHHKKLVVILVLVLADFHYLFR